MIEFEKEFGYAIVHDGEKKILNTTDERFGEKKRRLTKEQFAAEWDKADESGRQKLMRTTLPVR